jgi:ATP-binding cassette, subfamily B, bacterial
MATARTDPVDGRLDTPVAELSGDMPEVAACSAFEHRVSSANLVTVLSALPRFARRLIGLAWQGAAAAAVTTAALHIITAAMSAFGLLAAAQALTALLATRPSLAGLRAALPTILVVLATYLLRGLAESGAEAASARLTPSLRRLAEERVVEAASRVDLVAFDDSEFHEAMVRARDISTPFIDQGARQLIELAGSMVALAAMGGTLAALNPVLLPVMALSVLPQAWAALHNARRGYVVMARTASAKRRLWLTSDLLAERACAAELRAFTAQPFLLAQYRRLASALEDTQIRLGYAQARYQLVGRALSGAGIATAYGLLAGLVATDVMSVGTAGAAVIAIQSGRLALFRSADAANRLYEQSLYVGDYDRFVTEAATRTRPTGDSSAPVDPETISVRGVTFSYPGQAEPAVRDVSLTTRRGEVLALVGENGSGKTTLALLLAGLYRPHRGTIDWDGVDLAGVDPQTVYNRVAMVMQSPARWPQTVRQNVTIGRCNRPDPTGAALSAAAMAANLDDLVAQLPNGWETLLSKQFKNGHDLSGGQWQRVAVARALYRDAPVLICDEPTAALDARAEAAVYDSLRTLAHGRTVVLITHRLATTRRADRIAVLHQGRLIEYGDHDSLMAAGGRYAELYSLQARAYHD